MGIYEHLCQAIQDWLIANGEKLIAGIFCIDDEEDGATEFRIDDHWFMTLNVGSYDFHYDSWYVGWINDAGDMELRVGNRVSAEELLHAIEQSTEGLRQRKAVSAGQMRLPI